MMKLSNFFKSTNCFLIVGSILALFTTELLCLPGSLGESSYSLNGDSSNRTLSSSSLPSTRQHLIRSSRSPPSTPEPYYSPLNSNGTNSQEHLPVSFGLLVATSNNSTAISYCITHFNRWSISHKQDNFYNLIRADRINFCSSSIKPPSISDDGFYILTNFNTKCPLSEQALNIVRFYPKSKGLIVSLPNDVNVYNIYVQQNITDPKFIIALIGEDSTAEIISKFGGQIRAMVYAPQDDTDDDRGIFDSSLMGIWCIAVVTVAIGGFSSGILRYGLFLNQQLQEGRDLAQSIEDGQGENGERNKKKKTKLDDASLDVTPMTVVFFVIYMCAVLLILYFFYSYLVFMMIIFFVVFCTISIYSLIMGLTVNYVAPLLVGKMALYGWRVGVTLVSLIAPVTWFFIRKNNQAWSLQDALAMIFCIHVLQMLRFPNFRITSLLLSLLFVYDIFFVFLTPFFTSDGESIMVKVATGGTSSEVSYSFGVKVIGETLPVVFQWPRSMTTTLLTDKCYQGRVFWTSKLGFGDVLVPGFLVSYCHALDLFQKTPYRLYFVVECIFYGIGLIITFVALHLMNAAQPALLYLVPATLIPPLVIAYFRNEMHILWYGPEPAAIEAIKIQRQSQVDGETRPALNNVSIDPSEVSQQNNAKESLVNDKDDSANNQNTQNS